MPTRGPKKSICWGNLCVHRRTGILLWLFSLRLLQKWLKAQGAVWEHCVSESKLLGILLMWKQGLFPRPLQRFWLCCGLVFSPLCLQARADTDGWADCRLWSFKEGWSNKTTPVALLMPPLPVEFCGRLNCRGSKVIEETCSGSGLGTFP